MCQEWFIWFNLYHLWINTHAPRSPELDGHIIYKELDSSGPCFIKGREHKSELNNRNQKANIDTGCSQDLARNTFLKVIKQFWKEIQAAGTELWDQNNKLRELEQRLSERNVYSFEEYFSQTSFFVRGFFFFLTNMAIFDSAQKWNISKALSSSTSLKLLLQSYTLRGSRVVRLRGIPRLWNFHGRDKDTPKASL